MAIQGFDGVSFMWIYRKFKNFFIGFEGCVASRLRQHKNELYKQSLIKINEYQFTSNFGENFTPIWNHHLSKFRGMENIRMLEIGNFEGRSAIWFLENVLTHESSTLTCVDPFTNMSQVELRFEHNVKLSGLSHKLTKIKAESDQVLCTLPKDSFDIIYIDGDHRAKGVLMDAVSSWFLLKRGGIMIFDDYKWKLDKPVFERPELAIDMFLEMIYSEREVLHKDYQVIIKK